MSLYKNDVPGFWNVLIIFVSIAILCLLWGLYFFVTWIGAELSNIPFILISPFALIPLAILWLYKHMSYEIGPQGFSFKKPIGPTAIWPYEYITAAKKTTISEQTANAIKSIPTKTYLNLGILPAKFLPGLINPSSVIVIETSQNDFLGRKIGLVISPKNQEQFIEELNSYLSSKKQES